MELKEKFGPQYKRVYRACKLLFKDLPLMYALGCSGAHISRAFPGVPLCCMHMHDVPHPVPFTHPDC